MKYNQWQGFETVECVNGHEKIIPLKICIVLTSIVLRKLAKTCDKKNI